jgi:aminoglycoside phosphotransferase (APT) family kinase protein
MSVAAVGGGRLRWDEVPEHIVAALTAKLGAPVVDAQSKEGGFSPGLASVLRLADGRSVFVKAAGLARNEFTPGMHRREAAILAALPPEVPAPRLLWTYDDGDWVALATEALDGSNPAQPWRPDELATFLRTAEALAGLLTPSPVEVTTVVDRLHEHFTGWRSLVARQPAGADQPSADRILDDWTRDNLDRLAALEADWVPAVAGTTLMHCDLRADNVVLTAAGAWVVDWPHACLGPAWLDLLLGLPCIAMQGGGDPQEIWDGYRPGRSADPDAVNAVLAAAAGYFVHSGLKPVPPYIPNIRRFQWAQGRAALAWLRRRIG